MFLGIHGIYAKYVSPLFHIACLLFLFSLLSGCVSPPQESVALVTVPETFSLGVATSYEVDPWARLNNITDTAAFELEAPKADYQTAVLIGQTPCTTAKPFSAHLPELPPLPETGLPLSIPTRRPTIKNSFLSLQAAAQKAAATANRLALLGNRTTLYRTLSGPIEWATRHKTGKGTTT